MATPYPMEGDVRPTAELTSFDPEADGDSPVKKLKTAEVPESGTVTLTSMNIYFISPGHGWKSRAHVRRYRYIYHILYLGIYLPAYC